MAAAALTVTIPVDQAGHCLKPFLHTPVHADVDLVDPAGKGFRPHAGFNALTLRREPVHLTAAPAAEMGMGPAAGAGARP